MDEFMIANNYLLELENGDIYKFKESNKGIFTAWDGHFSIADGSGTIKCPSRVWIEWLDKHKENWKLYRPERTDNGDILYKRVERPSKKEDCIDRYICSKNATELDDKFESQTNSLHDDIGDLEKKFEEFKNDTTSVIHLLAQATPAVIPKGSDSIYYKIHSMVTSGVPDYLKRIFNLV